MSVSVFPAAILAGRTPQGVRGLKCSTLATVLFDVGRTPQGVRGLKSSIIGLLPRHRRRTPQGVRGLKWGGGGAPERRDRRRTPQGVRGLKYLSGDCECFQGIQRRTPQGVRGLKSMMSISYSSRSTVAPRKGRVD